MVAAITDAIIEAANVAIPCGRPNKRQRKQAQATTVLVRRLQNAVPDQNMTRMILVRNEANTTIRLQHAGA